MNKKYKHVLITGGAGYIGVSTVSLLLSKGYEVTVLDNLLWGGDVLLPYIGNKKFHFLNIDITNKTEVKKSFDGIDIVIHLAAIVGYPACRKYPELSKKTNEEGTLNVVAAAEKNVPIIFASTGSAYGKMIEKYCTETTPLNPLSNYGRQKVVAEKLVQKNMKYIIYRFATAFGSAPRLRLDLLINDFTYRAVKEKTLIVYEKEFMRTFIHVSDIARSFLFAIEHYNQMEGHIFNVGNESMNISKEGICNLIMKYTSCHLHFVDNGYDIDQRDYIVSYEKIRNIGFKTKISIEEGIKELVEAYKLINIKNPYSNV